MISTRNRWRTFLFLLITIYLMGALFFFTNEKSSNTNMLQNAQEPNSEMSSSIIATNLPELKQGIYERADSRIDAKIGFTKHDLSKSSHITMKQDVIIDNEEIVKSTKDERLNILFWNSYWNWPFFGMGVGNRGFVSNKCKYQNCYTTNQREKIRDNHTRIDAIVVHGEWVHGIDKELAKLAETNNFRQELMTKNQGHNPLFVYFFREPPRRSMDEAYSKQSNLFDITYTYRRDSDIPFSFGKFIPRYFEYSQDNKILQNKSAIDWRPIPTKLSSSLNDRDFGYKTKDILWIVSHCETDSKREFYVKKLQSHLSTLSIDVMGKCGNDILPKRNRARSRLDQQIHDREKMHKDLLDREKMYKEFLKPYKFFLAFENTNCLDYISEKFFTSLRTEEVIPIALGGKSVHDYATSAPPHSYIHVNEYPSVEALANKLEYLSQNQTAYKEYFWWTEYYKVSGTWDHYISSQCDLCEKMNLVHQKRLKLKQTNLFDFLSAEKNCHYDTSRFM